MSQRLPFLLNSRLLEAAHIILVSFNGFEESYSAELVGPDFSLFKSLDCLVLQHKIAITWDMLRSWCHKLYSACISTTSGLIFTNQVALESPKWGLSALMQEVQK